MKIDNMSFKEYIKDRTKKYFAPLTWALAAFVLVEEAIWNWGARQMEKLGAFKAIQAIESKISSLSPYWALVVFLLPSLILNPAEYFGMKAIAEGHWIIGGLIFLAAKVIGLALFARIFNLTKPALLQFKWFVWVYGKVTHYLDRIHAYLDNWETYQNIKNRLSEFKNSILVLIKVR